MFNPNLTLERLFAKNSLCNMRTENHAPMAHSGKDGVYYITIDSWHEKSTKELKELLEEGNIWEHGDYSISSYITLSDKANEIISSRLIKYGPGCNSSSFHIYVTEYATRVRMTASGWGCSVIELYDGDKQTFIDYFKNHQKRQA